MIVLNHLNKLNASNCVFIPPFQAGHLGFIPDRSVQVYLLKENESPPAHCEITVTPFETRGKGDLLRLVCVMHEDTGVVKRLLRSLALMNVNVVAQESSTIQNQKYHYISMIIDISTSSSLNRRSDRDVHAESVYTKEAGIVPLHQKKYVELFETIMAYCGDVITFNDRGLPRLSIRAFDMDEIPLNTTTSTIERVVAGDDSKKGVLVRIDDKLVGMIRRYLATPKDEPLSYFLISETEYRRLRIVFTKHGQTCNLLQVGFSHNDVPGSLNSIMNVLSDRDFSIVTSLHRSIDSDTSIWESILWYRGGETFPAKARLKRRMEWLARTMTSDLDEKLLADIMDKDVSVCVPLYPGRPNFKPIQPIHLDSYIAPSLKGKSLRSPTESEKWNERTDRMIPELDRAIGKLQSRRDEATTPAVEMLERIRGRRLAKSTIFISCSASEEVSPLIKQIEDYIAKHFGDFFTIDKYRKPNSDDAVRTVLSKVARCDGFIGIWHEDTQIPIGTNPGFYGTSPWMLYEFGQAHALGKDCFLVRSAKVDKRFYTAITPSYIMLEYSAKNFAEVIFPGMRIWCEKLHKDQQKRMV